MALVRYWRRKYAFRLAALLLSVVLTIAIIEIALRLLGMMYDSRIYRAAQAPTDATCAPHPAQRTSGSITYSCCGGTP